MTDPSSSIPPPADDPQGSLGAVLIGGAILLIAGLFLFWPTSDSATAERRAGATAAAQGSNAGANQRNGGGGGVAGGGAGGLVHGIDPRDADPARAHTGQQAQVRVSPAHFSSELTMAPPPPPVVEPTSFASKAEEIAYVEKKLVQARADLDARATFLDRMRKIQQKSTSVDEDDRNAARAQIVQKNYETARVRVETLEKRLESLR